VVANPAYLLLQLAMVGSAIVVVCGIVFRCARETLHATRLAAKSMAVDRRSNVFAITENGGTRRSMTRAPSALFP